MLGATNETTGFATFWGRGGRAFQLATTGRWGGVPNVEGVVGRMTLQAIVEVPDDAPGNNGGRLHMKGGRKMNYWVWREPPGFSIG